MVEYGRTLAVHVLKEEFKYRGTLREFIWRRSIDVVENCGNGLEI